MTTPAPGRPRKPLPPDLHLRLDCDFSTGKLFWRAHPDYSATWNAKHAGREAGHLDKDGYIVIFLKGYRAVYAHRIVWALYHGVDPPYELDHRDGQRARNAIANLRPSDRLKSAQNRGTNRNNTSGQKGVIVTPSGRFVARLDVNRERIYLGTFDTLEEARQARLAAEKTHHPLNRFHMG